MDSSLIDIRKLDANQLLKEKFKPKEPNAIYACKIKQFRKWFDNKNCIGPANGKHMTIENTDKYFLLDQRHEVTMLTKNVTQMKHVIQFCACFYEDLPPATRFRVKSRIVQECVEEHHRKHSENRMNKTESAHSNLHSDALSKE